jgi:hypothetical protein
MLTSPHPHSLKKMSEKTNQLYTANQPDEMPPKAAPKKNAAPKGKKSNNDGNTTASLQRNTSRTRAKDTMDTQDDIAQWMQWN